MSRVLDQIIVIDVEATCWEGQPPPGEEPEIIEIGLCLLHVGRLERGEKRSILVRPERSRVSPFCTRLTTLTQEQVEEGISFKDACTLLRREYHALDRTWASYGDYDRRQFERQCAPHAVQYPFGLTHLNVKSLFALSNTLIREVGMAEALALRRLPLEGMHHRAHDDAWNIAALLADLIAGYRH